MWLLDEIDVLGLPQQAKLLRVIETGEFEPVGSNETRSSQARLIVASNVDLTHLMERNKFRADLYYRLNTLTLDVPPLRDRRDEIRPMVNQFIDEANRLNNREVNGLTPEALQVLETYHWPGNVRELRNAVERAVVIAVGDYITADDLPQRLRGEFPSDSGDLGPPEDTDSSESGEGNPPVLPLKQAVEALERELIASALAATEGNQSRAAQLLDMSRRTFIYKMQRYEIPDNGGAVGPLLPKFDSEGRRLGFKRRIEVLEKRLLKQALHTAEGDRTQAASLLEIQRRTLDQKLARYNLEPDHTP